MSNPDKEILEDIQELREVLGDTMRQYAADLKKVEEYVDDMKKQVMEIFHDVKKELENKERLLRSRRGRQ